MELHFLTPRMELERGCSLNIAPPGYQRAYDALRDVLNKEHGWVDPEAPERARDVRSIIEEVRRGDAREKLHDWLLDRIAEGGVQDRNTMVETLRDAGFDIPCAGKNYLTVRDAETDERFRLKGESSMKIGRDRQPLSVRLAGKMESETGQATQAADWLESSLENFRSDCAAISKNARDTIASDMEANVSACRSANRKILNAITADLQLIRRLTRFGPWAVIIFLVFAIGTTFAASY